MEIRDRKTRVIRFWIESVVAAAALVLGLLTVVWRDWIEAVFGVDPDHHSGSAEWFVVVGLLAIAAVVGVAARLDWRRLHLALNYGQ